MRIESIIANRIACPTQINNDSVKINSELSLNSFCTVRVCKTLMIVAGVIFTLKWG